ncbi:hypothetical protein H8E77_11090 [bacterium]|nr:hypothetical protein [bacterium]
MSNEQRDLRSKSVPQIEKIVRQLVQSHFEIEPNIDEIVWFRDGVEQEIRLIEINRDTLPTGSVEVFSFAPIQDVPFPVRIADITPQEWKQVRSGDIPLPLGWTLRQIQIFQR